MTGPGPDDGGRRTFLESPRWMDGTLAGCAAPALAVMGVAAAVTFVVIAVLGATGHLSPAVALSTSVTLALAAVVYTVLYRAVSRRATFSDRPAGVPRENLFSVRLPVEGGWLKRWMEPARSGHLVFADDHLRLLYRPKTQYFILSAMTLTLVVRPLVPRGHHGWLLAGVATCWALWWWTAWRRRDLRIPWDRIHSAAVKGRRFHVETHVEEHPDGILLEVPSHERARLAASLAAHTRFEDLDPEPPPPDLRTAARIEQPPRFPW